VDLEGNRYLLYFLLSVIGCGHVLGLLLRRIIQPRAGMAMREPKADQQIELIGSCTKNALLGPDLSEHFPHAIVVGVR